MLIGRVMRFYGGAFQEYWNMPAPRFFALHRAMDKMDAQEKTEAIDIQAVAICSHKYVEILKTKYQQQYEGSDSGEKPPTEGEIVMSDMDHEKKTSFFMEQLADYKRLNYGQ